ncbi:hypothetical protein NHG29_06730 [Aerococcaceae bacterium NML160702]|nr:hypothetical protein [Aerococcaceae bacterium NML180378]MCW6682571.1 hypothetical protein [Aerococcaceae bacterium NML160702]
MIRDVSVMVKETTVKDAPSTLFLSKGKRISALKRIKDMMKQNHYKQGGTAVMRPCL